MRCGGSWWRSARSSPRRGRRADRADGQLTGRSSPAARGARRMAARTRRQFLREGGALLGAAALAPLSVRVSTRTPQAKRVLVIGAGAAGLSAAYELNRGG